MRTLPFHCAIFTARAGIAYVTFDRAIKESTATAVNMMVGISMTTADPMLVLKKVMVASQPLGVGTTTELASQPSQREPRFEMRRKRDGLVQA